MDTDSPNKSRSQTRVKLASKLNDRVKLVKQRTSTRRRMRTLEKTLERKEAEIELVEQEIQRTKLLRQRRNARHKLKTLAKTLETVEAGIELVELEIQCLERKMAVGQTDEGPESDSDETTSPAAAQSEETSALNAAEKQSQIVINIDIMEKDGNHSSISEGSSASATGDPVPKVIVTSFDPKADSFEAAFSKAAESQSLASEASLENGDGKTTNKEAPSMTSSDAEVVEGETCDPANTKGLSLLESSSTDSESSGSSSEFEVMEVETGSSRKQKKEAGSGDSLVEPANEGFHLIDLDSFGDKNLFGVLLTNYQQKLSEVEDSIEKVKQERGEIETTLNLKDAKKKLLKKELALLRKEISLKRTQLEELQKKEDLLYKEKSNLKNKLVHCETLKNEREVRRAHLK